jgi:hypothetical protein
MPTMAVLYLREPQHTCPDEHLLRKIPGKDGDRPGREPGQPFHGCAHKLIGQLREPRRYAAGSRNARSFATYV